MLNVISCAVDGETVFGDVNFGVSLPRDKCRGGGRFGRPRSGGFSARDDVERAVETAEGHARSVTSMLEIHI